jgi:peroxiredoxin
VTFRLFFPFIALALAAWSADEHPTLAIGSAAPDFSLPGIDGRMHTLGEYSGSRVLVIIFTCNHCPTAQLYESRIKQLVEDYRQKSVALVAIEPNDPKAILLSELGYTDVSDSLEEMKIRAEYRQFNFPYLYDGETQAVAQAYGPKATPHVFIFDGQRKLAYEGRIDNSQRESLVKTRDARNAINALLAGAPVPVDHTGVFGCSTKWKSKAAGQLNEMRHSTPSGMRACPLPC